MGLVEYIHPMLVHLDYTSNTVRLYVIGASLLFFTSLYLSSTFLSQFLWTYKNLISREKVFWNLTVLRAIFGILATTVGVWAIWFDTEVCKDVVFGATSTSHFTVQVAIGFFILECAILTYSDVKFHTFNALLHVHHWLALSGYITTCLVASSHHFACVSLMLEMTTPFSCICWTLLKCGKSESRIWHMNQIVLVHLFHCRSLIEGYMFLQSYRHWNYISSAMPWPVFILFYTGLVICSVFLTPFWTYKKTLQLTNRKDWNFVGSESTRQMNGHVPKGD